MYSLLLTLALASAANPASERTQTASVCVAARLRHFVGPTGAPRSWPVTPQLPPTLEGNLGVLLSDQGAVADGYSHRLLVDKQTATSYVVQRGGFSGLQTIYGPFPVFACSQDAPRRHSHPSVGRRKSLSLHSSGRLRRRSIPALGCSGDHQTDCMRSLRYG